MTKGGLAFADKAIWMAMGDVIGEEAAAKQRACRRGQGHVTTEGDADTTKGNVAFADKVARTAMGDTVVHEAVLGRESILSLSPWMRPQDNRGGPSLREHMGSLRGSLPLPKRPRRRLSGMSLRTRPPRPPEEQALKLQPRTRPLLTVQTDVGGAVP